MLWIAFIFQYLWDTKQHHSKEIVYVPSCELLSFISIFGIQNNKFKQDFWVDRVVNCFHFSVSLGYKTTNGLEYYYESELWIAFIFQYLWDTKQHYCMMANSIRSCELLSFFSIFGIQNNKIIHYARTRRVVNCFHFSVSLGYKTTNYSSVSFVWLLWIAFIFQYLWDTKQLKL